MQNTASPVINKSPLNNSKSKACFLFSKSPKNQEPKSLNDTIYDLPSMMDKRSTSIGFGKKTSLGPLNDNPSPDKYNKQSDFSKNPSKGQTFGVSRANYKAISIFSDNNGPGPCDYDTSLLESSKNCFSIRGRDGFPKIFNSSHIPGPGHYQTKQWTNKEFYADSRRKSPKNYTIKKAKNSEHKQNNVGPGSYETSLASMGKQILASKKTQKAFCFTKETRETMPLIKSNVGPGSYQHFSQFGRIL